jgi:ornithine cyclodeaminase/alanine dehydrogenase-like protein (mu-crystallin family)
MAPLLLLNAEDVRNLIDLPTLFGALEVALRELSAGNASVPPRTVARTPTGFLGSMPGYLPGTLEAKLVAVFPRNHDRGLPSHQALIALFDEDSGAPLCVMDGTVITAVRTGATAAVAARALARDGASSLAVLGAGVQGRSHLDAFPRLFELDDVRVTLVTPRRSPRRSPRLERSTRSRRPSGAPTSCAAAPTRTSRSCRTPGSRRGRT